jgi:hypothetical protein
MVLFNIVPRNQYHKNGTQWIGKIFARAIGESRYEWFRLEKRIFYTKFWYTKQNFLLRFQSQWPYIAAWFSLLNKQDTSDGLPKGRTPERYQDFAVYNINHEGWYQLYFVLAATAVALWNWYVVAFCYDIRGVSPEDEDLYWLKDARHRTSWDRTKYNFAPSFHATHNFAALRRVNAWRDDPMDPRLNWIVQYRGKNPYGLDRYVKYYGYSKTMRLV